MSAMFETEGHFCDGVRDRFWGENYTVALAFLYADVAFLFCFFEKGYTPFHTVITV